MPDDLYEVKDPAVQQWLLKIGLDVKKELQGTNLGFTLFLYNFGPDGAMFYLSSGNRDDMLKMLREFITKEEKRHGTSL
jgi:hypothetical protein